jgi:hypothetical protein
MKLLVAILFMLLPFASLAADEPEVVYGKFHRAVMAGDLEEMLKYGPAQRRAEILGLSASSKEAALRMAQFMMPRAFALNWKTVQANGRAATLIVSGPWADEGTTKLETMYGTVRMLLENGEWKVDEASWSSEKPAIVGAAKPPADGKAAAKAAPAGKAGAPVVGAMEASPGRTLGAAKPECVYKPVMTAQDIENCK